MSDSRNILIVSVIILLIIFFLLKENEDCFLDLAINETKNSINNRFPINDSCKIDKDCTKNIIK
jgi:hypothetical protein